MKIIELFKSKKPVIAFEIFPPKPETPLEKIYASLAKFKRMKPDYVSVTYGALGGTKVRTIEITSKIKKDYQIESMAHLTCIGHKRESIDEILKDMHANNLQNVLALRGDPPSGQSVINTPPGGFEYANQLVEYIKSKNGFCIGAAAYVEGHSECYRIKDDLVNLKNKVDAGVDFLVTQLFFDNRKFFDFIDRIRRLGIKCPVAPGIMPVFKADQIKAITAKSGCSIPASLVLMMDKYGSNPDDLRKAGIEYAAKQIRELMENGADGIHLYTMNRPISTENILKQAGIFGNNTV